MRWLMARSTALMVVVVDELGELGTAGAAGVFEAVSLDALGLGAVFFVALVVGFVLLDG